MSELITGLLSAAGLLTGLGSGIAAGNKARDEENAANAYNKQIEDQNKAYRLEVMQFQNEEYAKDVGFYRKQIAYEEGEFDRAKALVNTAKANIEKNWTQQLGTALLRSVQTDIAHTLQRKDITDQGFAAFGKVDVSNAERGVGGNSAALLSGEVARQVGVARTASDRNFNAAETQAKLELLGLKGQRDSALASQTMPTFAPIQPPPPPAPVSPVNPAAPAPHVSTGTIVLGALTSGLNGASTGASLAKAFLLPTPAA